MQGSRRTTLTLYLPALLPLPYTRQGCERVSSVLSEVCALGQFIEVDSDDIDGSMITFSVVKDLPTKHRSRWLKRRHPVSRRLPKIWMKCEASSRLSPKGWAPPEYWDKEGMRPVSEADKRAIKVDMFYGAFLHTIRILVMASNVARPGALRLGDGICISDGQYYRDVPSFNHGIDSVFEDCAERGWPIVKDLNIQQSWIWFKRQPGIFAGLSASRVSRALNAFSRLFFENFENSEDQNFLWSMIGLEAIYTDRVAGINEQIFGKSKILLGDPVKAKDVLKIYDYRSRLLHGQKNIPNRWTLMMEYPSTNNTI